MTCGDRDKNALYGDIAPGGTDFLKFAYLISTKDNVFTVTYSLGIYTLFAKRTHPLGRCGCRCIQSFSSCTASVTRWSLGPNSLLTLSSTSSLGGSITSSEISYVLSTICSIQYRVIYCTAF